MHTKEQFSIGDAADLQLITKLEREYILQLARQQEWSQPSIVEAHHLQLDKAIDYCRRAWTVARGEMESGVEERIAVFLTMKLLQIKAKLPRMFANGNLVVEHMVYHDALKETKLVIVPHNMSDSELQDWLESDGWRVIRRDVQYTVQFPE